MEVDLSWKLEFVWGESGRSFELKNDFPFLWKNIVLEKGFGKKASPIDTKKQQKGNWEKRITNKYCSKISLLLHHQHILGKMISLGRESLALGGQHTLYVSKKNSNSNFSKMIKYCTWKKRLAKKWILLSQDKKIYDKYNMNSTCI
jgi:hypothetical protein